MAQLAAIPQTGGLGSIAQLIQQLAPIFLGSGATNTSGSGTQTTGAIQTQTQGTTPDIVAAIQQLLGQVQGNAGQFSKEAAIQDSTGAINTQILDAIRANMPSVLAGQKGAGLYNDTTTSLLQNDLMARIAGEAQKAQTATIGQYGQLANQNNQIAQQLLSSLAQTQRTATNNQSQTQATSENKTQQTQPILSPAKTAGGLGILGGISALKQGGDLFKGGKSLWESIFPTGEPAAPVGTFAGFNPATDFTGGGFNDMLDSDVLAGMGDFGSNLATSFGAFDPSGVNFGDFTSLFGSAGDAASQIGNYAGVGSDLSGVFTGASDTLNSVGSGIDFSADLGSMASGGGDLLASLGGMGKDFLDDLGSFGSSVGDFFGGFFADGGMVNTDSAAFGIYADGGKVRKPKGYADGGPVDGDLPKNVQRGRAGGKSYTDEASTAKSNGGFGNLQRMRALWEQAVPGASGPNFNAPTAIAGNEDALGGTVRGGSVAMLPEFAALQELANGREGRRSAAIDAQIQAAINKVQTALEQQADANEPSIGQQALKFGQQARSVYSAGDKAATASQAPTVGAATVADIGVAEGIGGAGAALGGSALSGGSLGTVDVLGSLAGNAFLPTYSAASGAAGTGASSALFGSASAGAAEGATAAGAGAAAGSEAAAAFSAGPAAAVVAIPLIASALMNTFFPDETPIDNWRRAADDPQRFFSSTGSNPNDFSFGLTQFFDPTNPQNAGLSREQMFQRAVQGAQNPNWWATEANRAAQAGGYGGGASSTDLGYLGAISPYVLQVAKYLKDSDQLNDSYYRTALKNQRYKAAGVDSGYDDSILGTGENKRKLKAIDDEVAGLSLDDVYSQLQGAQNILSPGQYQSSQSQNLTAAQQMQLQGIPDRMLGFGGSGGFTDTVSNTSGSGGGFLVAKANGGMIGTPAADPKGNKDNVPILASQGEYIIPKPVVDTIGQDFFDGLLAAFNVPSAVR